MQKRLASETEIHKFAQFEFFQQWEKLRSHCTRRGISIMGDIPIYVAHDSADVWAHPELFRLDEQAKPTAVAGVPPDYFSATGQRWGNPLYRWDVSDASGHRWWINRFRASLKLFDLVRLDHFRGFEAHWEVPASASTADAGKWVKGPGAQFFQALQTELKELPFVAENLGVITPEVEALRRQFGFPGMSLLQFAFGSDPQGPTFRPYNYSRELVAYTGGHDNDTTVGWWTSSGGGEHSNRRRHPQGTRFHPRVLGVSKRAHQLGIYSQRTGVCGRDRHHTFTRCIGPRHRSPNEFAGHGKWKLEMALRREGFDEGR